MILLLENCLRNIFKVLSFVFGMGGDRHIKLGLYRHSKSGDLYEVIAVGAHSETLERLVVYRGLYWSENFGNHPVWVRPLEMFEEIVVVEGREVQRFVLVEERRV
jgi:hypothetical protein